MLTLHLNKNEPDQSIEKLARVVLHTYNSYRLLIICGLFLFTSVQSNLLLGSPPNKVYQVMTDGYLLFAISMIGVTLWHRFSAYTLTVIGVMIDLSMLSILMYFNHSMTEVFIILINSIIAIGSIVTAGLLPLLFAAIASLATLFLKSGLAKNQWQWTNLAAAGLYSISYFATAILAFSLSVRIRASEILAKEKQQEILSLEYLSQMIISQMDIGVIILDETQKIIFINPSALRLVDWKQARDPIDIVQYSSVLSDVYFSQALGQHEDQFSFTVEALYLSIRVILLSQWQKKPTYAILFLEDSRKSYQKAQELKLASLGRLTASVAHEIRNPLNAIAQAAQLLSEKEFNDSQEETLVNIIDRQTHRIDGIVKNILHLPGERKAKPGIIELETWMSLFLKELKSTMPLDAEIECFFEKKGLTIFFDQEHLRQVLFNLCDNAGYFSQQKLGYVKLNIYISSKEAQNSCDIRVEDYGPGIKKNQQKYLFEPFFTTKDKGTGLGLYITLQLCQANYATLTYENSQKAGACFVITARMRETAL